MGQPNLDEARRLYSALRDIVIHHHGGWADYESLGKMRKLVNAALAAVDDVECHQHLESAAEHSAEVFSENGHKKWDRSYMTGVDFLRLRILRELDAFHSRLFALEAMARAAAKSSTNGSSASEPRYS
ncbi:MAG TPA: hypothetical protein VE756_15375 [Burkholderiales bacterium]|jgi:hypothetical protein|nr:hypothetical protein [Burkholderiales bacterium]